MKLNFFLLILFISYYTCFSQELKKIKVDNGMLSEVYYVLKSNKTIRHGSYELKIFNEIGQKGQYTNGEKSGDWHYYEMSPNFEFIYNFDSTKIVSDKEGMERPALYSEGYKFFNYLIISSIKYPTEAINENMFGTVWVSFSIDANGAPSDFIVSSGFVGKPLEEEALRVVKKAAMEHFWFPAINAKGEKDKFSLKWPVSFRIQQ